MVASPVEDAAGSSGFGFMGAPAEEAPTPPTGGGDMSSGFGFMGGGGGTTTINMEQQSGTITSAFQGLDAPNVMDDGLGGAGGSSSSSNSSSSSSSSMHSIGSGSGLGSGSGSGLGSGVGGGEASQEANNMLSEHEANLEILEQKCASIQTIVYQFEEMRTQFLNAKAELAQLNGNLERLQSQGIDTVVVQHLDPSSQEIIKASRKILVQRVAFLFDQISVTADYMSTLTV